MKTISLRMTTLALLAALSLTCADFVQAQPDRAPSKEGPCQEAPLTPEQMESVKKMSEAFFEQTLPLRQALIVKKAELKAQMISPQPDTAKVIVLSREIGELRGKMKAARITLRVELEKQGIPASRCPMLKEGPRHRGPACDRPRGPRHHGAIGHWDCGPGPDHDRGPRGHRGHGDCLR